MSAGTVTRAQLQAQQVAADAAAVAAAAAVNAPVLPHIVQPNAAPGGVGNDALAQAIIAMLAQQQLQAQAALAESQAARASAQAAAYEALSQQRRAGAGPPPLFLGQSNSIEVHRWVIALERWFTVAYIAANDDEERLIVAPSVLRDSAQIWWTAQLTSGQAVALNTWILFSTAIRSHFLPMDVERWALTELDVLVSKSVKSGDVADYTSKFIELDLLLPKDSALSRIMAYERGLPEEYRYKCAEKRHSTLVSATEAMLAIWNAKTSARLHSRGVVTPAPLGQMMDIDREAKDEANRSSTFTPGPASMDPRAIAEQVFAMISERFPPRGTSNYRGRGGYGRGRGGMSSNGRQRERGTGEGQRSGSRPHTPGISDDVARARIKAGQCIRCGEDGHFRSECPNSVKPTN
jgi:hypothetical protein